ncbi:SRPBCC domain-containing protein [uncultured Tateyamaria sp.]|uniref:SRPBCC domain-containing protein n=1 Tax=uncultured Tateyamaria sp. TaxID=455651 RepID=UPI002629F3A9|nr:SRPBCC domain-containing protein [uncultured Tateyamaria sp.]
MQTPKQTYETQIKINASCARVWHTLTQTMPKAPTDYGILRLDGALTLGAKIKLWSEVAPKRAFALTVTTFDAPTRMTWRGGMPLGLFVGTRQFSIAPDGTGSMFEMREQFSGPLAGVISSSIPDLTPSFVKFANTLKQEAERT